MQDQAYRYLLSLLPPGRRPAEGGVADGIVRMLGGYEARLMGELFALVQEAFPHLAEDLSKHARGRMVMRIPSDEREDRFRARVVGAVEWWRWAGTLRGLRYALDLVGLPAEVVEGPFHNTFDGSWAFDYAGGFTDPAWAEFALRVTPTGAFRTSDSHYLRALIRELKPAHAVLRTVELRIGDRRVLRLVPAGLSQLWDLGTFGDFAFGDLRRTPHLAQVYVVWQASARVIESGTFGGWEFDGRGL